MGIKDLNKKYEINEILKEKVFFVQQVLLHGELMNGVKKR